MQDHTSKGKAKFSGRKRNFSQAKWYCQGHIPEWQLRLQYDLPTYEAGCQTWTLRSLSAPERLG